MHAATCLLGFAPGCAVIGSGGFCEVNDVSSQLTGPLVCAHHHLQRGFRCLQEHTLRLWDSSPYRHDNVPCNVCRQPINIAQGFLHCHACAYDMCRVCQAAQAAVRARAHRQAEFQIVDAADSDSDVEAGLLPRRHSTDANNQDGIPSNNVKGQKQAKKSV